MKIEVAETLIDGSSALLFVALDGRGRIVGSCTLGSWDKPHPILYSLFVKAANRRTGVASAIVGACIRRARRYKKAAIALTVAHGNKGARALYRRLGFVSFTADATVTWMGLALDQ